MDKNTAPRAGKKPFSLIAALIFALASLAHLLRLVFGWEVLLNGMLLPVWASFVICLLTAGLSYGLCRELRK